MHQSILLTLLPLYKIQINKTIEHTYYYGKFLEVVSLYFSDKEADNTSCPFLNDENILKKIKEAKEILITELKNPPTIAELARKVSIPEYQLKSGFKELYGNTIYGYALAKKWKLLVNSWMWKTSRSMKWPMILVIPTPVTLLPHLKTIRSDS